MNDLAVAIDRNPLGAWLTLLSALAALWVAAMHLRMWWTGPRLEKPPEKEWR